MKKERKIWYEAVDKLLIFAWRRTKVKISWWRTHTRETAKKQHQGVLKWRGERILWWRTIWHHGKDHTSYKEDAFVIAAAFTTCYIFVRNYVCFKVKKVFVFHKVMHLWEKIINFNQDIQSGENLDILNYF